LAQSLFRRFTLKLPSKTRSEAIVSQRNHPWHRSSRKFSVQYRLPIGAQTTTFCRMLKLIVPAELPRLPAAGLQDGSQFLQEAKV